MTDSERALLAAWRGLDYEGKHNVDETLLASIDALAAQASELVDLAARPGTRAQVSKLLIPFADMLGCPVPGEEGLDLMTDALVDLPAGLHDLARVRVAQSHRYKRLPLPAEFIAAVAGELAYIESQRRLLINMVSITTSVRQRRTSGARILQS